jgi:hypothetical protein
MLFFDPEYSRTFSKNNVKILGSAYAPANIHGVAFFVTFGIDAT